MADIEKTKALEMPSKDLDYFGVLKNAFGMVRHHRYLWYLGILAGGGMGTGFNAGGGDFNNLFQLDKKDTIPVTSDIPFRDTNSALQFLSGEAMGWVQDNWTLVFIVAIAVSVFFVIFLILSLMAKVGLVHSVDSLSKNEESSFMKALRFGWHKFWRVFGASILLGLVVSGMIALVVVFLFLLWGKLDKNVDYGIGGVISLLSALLIFFTIIVTGVIYEYTLRYIALGDKKAIASLKSGYGLLKSRKKETALIWLITVGVAIVAGVLLVMAVLLLGLILFLLGLLFFILSPIVGVIYAVIAVTAFIVALFLASGFISSLLSAYWTLCFKELEA